MRTRVHKGRKQVARTKRCLSPLKKYKRQKNENGQRIKRQHTNNTTHNQNTRTSFFPFPHFSSLSPRPHAPSFPLCTKRKQQTLSLSFQDLKLQGPSFSFLLLALLCFFSLLCLFLLRLFLSFFFFFFSFCWPSKKAKEQTDAQNKRAPCPSGVHQR